MKIPLPPMSMARSLSRLRSRALVRSCATLLALGSLIAVSAAHSQNLLTNPNFSGGTIAPWAPGNTVYDAQSASADGSGSAAGSLLTTGAVMNAISQCVTGIVPGTYYNVAGKTLIPSGQSSLGVSRLLPVLHF